MGGIKESEVANYDETVRLLNDQKTQLKDIKNATTRAKQLLSQLGTVPVASSVGGLKDNLLKILPSHLIPGNVGNLNDVSWPFWYSFNFDLGDDPSILPRFSQSASFQVSQEAAFLFMGISRSVNSSSIDSLPLGVEIRDRQSSRFFNNAPIPMQMIGAFGNPTILPTPMLIMPNAVYEMELKGIAPQTASASNGTGNGKIQFTLHGFRMRVEDAGKVLSSIFG